MLKIYPSLISADLLHLADEFKKLDGLVDGYHIDVMDGNFVPNITWGPAFVTAFAMATSRPLHVHLMTLDAKRWLTAMNLRPGDYAIFHIETYQESYDEAKLFITDIKNLSVRAGIAINPATNVALVEPLIDLVDDVLIMSVEPGFSGQRFMDSVKPKIGHLAKLREQRGLAYSMSIDGGVRNEHLPELYQLGIENFCMASALFDATDTVAAIGELRRLVATQ